MDPGPANPSVLTKQASHRSHIVWNDPSDARVQKLELRRAVSDIRGGDIYFLQPRMVPYLQMAGFYGIARLGFMQLDYSLITALVERWRPETHTFHIYDGECTVTLQDVEFLLGLPVDGEAVTGYRSVSDWSDLCEELLGHRPEARALKGNCIQTYWLKSTFQQIPNNASEEVVMQHTRACIMKLLAGVLIPNKSTDDVYLGFLILLRDLDRCGRYSWGSAVLAHV